jgi:hypothetical protein
MSLLGHSDPRTTEKHYDQALSDKAVLNYQNSLERHRRRLKAERQRKAS